MPDEPSPDIDPLLHASPRSRAHAAPTGATGGRRPTGSRAQQAAALRELDVVRVRVFSILAGGAAGALARGGVGEALPHERGSFPWATFTVNLAGAFILAWSTTRLAERVAPTRYWRLLLGTGFCGAITTFSTFQVETIRLAKDGYPWIAAAYTGASLALGMMCAIAGTIIARRGRYG